MNKSKKILLFSIIMLIILCWCNISKGTTYYQEQKEANSSNNNGIANFPASYREALTKLVESTGHTNWKFVAFYTGIDWNTLVEKETDCLHNTIHKSNPSSWLDSCGQQGDEGYYCASKEIISYYMDTRNFLTETTIFQFLNLSNTTKASVQDIRECVKGTYLAGSANGQEYAQMIYDAAEVSGESAYSIIVKIFQELGNGTSLPYMISGNDSDYPGIYNFFNYGATDGAGNLQRGLAYAESKGWNTPQKALIEGAKLIAGTYTKAGQVNKYLFKFDVVGTTDSQLFKHQYMTNVQDPNSQAKNLYKTYDSNDLLDKSLTFVIPIYNNMPAYVKLPGGSTSGELYYVSSNYDNVNVRDKNGNVVESYRKDTVVTMIQKNAVKFNNLSFAKVSYNGQERYIAMKYLSKVNTEKDAIEEKYLGGEKDNDADISYKAQLENIGWTDWSKNGETIGTIGGERRLETINIVLNDNLKSEEIQYRTHVQDYGWMNWVSEGENSGTVGKSKRVEAIQIKLKETSDYKIYYRVHVQDIGWMDWVCNGAIAGTTGQSKRIEAIQIKIEESYTKNSVGELYKGESKINNNSLINYNTYVEEKGWMGWISDGEKAGSTGQNRKLSSIKIQTGDLTEGEIIQYRVHIQDIGWTNWVENGTKLGNENQNKRIEAMQIKLKDDNEYNVKYRVHVQDIGWMDWKENGEVAGTTGESKRIEAIEIKLEATGNIGISYKTHVQDIGWMNWKQNGEMSGTEGKSKRVEAINIKLNGIDPSIENAIQYRVHVQDYGWMNWKQNGEMAGTEGKSKRVEAIQIKLNSELEKNIKYRVHVQDIGWMSWKENGEIAGTEGQSKRIEAIEIVIE